MSTQDESIAYGWTEVPRSQSKLLRAIDPANSKPVQVAELPTPTGRLVDHVMQYAKKELNEQTFNHSMRVYYYGASFPDRSSTIQTCPCSTFRAIKSVEFKKHAN